MIEFLNRITEDRDLTIRFLSDCFSYLYSLLEEEEIKYWKKNKTGKSVNKVDLPILKYDFFILNTREKDDVLVESIICDWIGNKRLIKYRDQLSDIFYQYEYEIKSNGLL